MNVAAVFCYHCAEPIPAGSAWTAPFRDETVAFCCPACLSVFELIQSSGLDGYYDTRKLPADRPEISNNDYLQYDLEEVQAPFVYRHNGICEAQLIIDGIHCSACAWLIEKHIAHLPGVAAISVQMNQQTARVSWHPGQINLSAIFQAIADLGYSPWPYHPQDRDRMIRRTQKAYLARLGVAGLAAMQVGMLSIPLYTGVEDTWVPLLRYSSLLLASIVVLYCAQPFFQGAWRGLRRGQPGMDVPVALAIGLAWLASIWATLRGGGEVYFDSVTMFAFFLLAGRYFEIRSRLRNGFFPRSLLPESALLLENGVQRRVGVNSLKAGEHILVRAGETVPADGYIHSGHGSLSEAAFTGEFLPVEKGPGDTVLAGSVNGDSIVEVVVQATNAEAALSTIERLVDRGLAQKPRISRLADTISRYFVVAVLIACALTYLTWLQISPQDAFWISLSVLVVSCPCALALATPTALATATQSLQRLGILITRGHVLETLPKLRFLVMDKTGTLTLGKARLERTIQQGTEDESRCRELATALEAQSSHPLAAAFVQPTVLTASAVTHHAGMGVEGCINGVAYRLGSLPFCQQWLQATLHYPDDNAHWLGLCRQGEMLAWFEIRDPLRNDAASTLNAMRERGLELHLLSGDGSGAVANVARQLGIEHWRSGASAEEKLNYVADLQKRGKVMMVGDGLNDLPVFAAADVSVAMAEAADLSKTRADCILLNDRLSTLAELLTASVKTAGIIRQNLICSLCYNSLMLPMAMLGWIPPYLAAIGMSASSLVVVGNSQRLLRRQVRPVVVLPRGKPQLRVEAG